MISDAGLRRGWKSAGGEFENSGHSAAFGALRHYELPAHLHVIEQTAIHQNWKPVHFRLLDEILATIPWTAATTAGRYKE
jgi:hypothetical protein